MSQTKQNSAHSSSKHNSSKSLPAVSLIATTLNEADSIDSLLQAVASQTHLPEEMIIVDGGSTDQTLFKIKQFRRSHPELNLKAYQQKGLNIAEGRNFAISKAKHELIAITDAGCIPQPNWLKELLKKQQKTQAPVVAGYYQGQPRTAFEQAVVPYVLVMPNQIDYQNFLPASRSMLLSKKIWEQLDGFREDLDVSEDFAFAHKLKKYHVKTAFARNAIVSWLPRSDLQEFFTMIYKFARYDIQAGIIRPKIILVFLRYWLGLVGLIWLWPNTPAIISFSLLTFSGYSVWAINKNKQYAPQGWHWLPMLQITADWGVMSGTFFGLLHRIMAKLTILYKKKSNLSREKDRV